MFKLEHNMNNILTGSYLFWNGQTQWKFPIWVCNFASTGGEGVHGGMWGCKCDVVYSDQ